LKAVGGFAPWRGVAPRLAATGKELKAPAVASSQSLNQNGSNWERIESLVD
jgi:hypothetical protein